MLATPVTVKCEPIPAYPPGCGAADHGDGGGVAGVLLDQGRCHLLVELGHGDRLPENLK